MIFFSCTAVTCPAVVRVVGFDEAEFETLLGQASEWFPDRYPCPICGERMAVFTHCPEGEAKFIDLSVPEAYCAFAGAGLPQEQECSATRVRELLTTLPVLSVQTRHIRGTNRCTLDCITLAGGVVLHLASSVHGACVYRIQVPNSFIGGVEDGHHSEVQAPS